MRSRTTPLELPAPRPIGRRTGWLTGLWILRRRHRFRVVGRSMLPTLPDGHSVLVNRHAYSSVAPVPGEVVLIAHPYQAGVLTIKRFAFARKDGLFVVGDNRDESADSRAYGLVPRAHLLGRVECLFP